MKKTKPTVKSIAAIALAVTIAGSMFGTAVTAETASSYYASSYSTNTSSYKIPTKIYMTNYMSGYAERQAKANSSINAAEGIMTTVNANAVTLGLAPIAFPNTTPSFGTTKYDYLIKANAENGATVLTFNSEANLRSAMTKIKSAEQTLMNNALSPYVTYIQSIISNGSYTVVTTTDTPEIKAAKISNQALLTAIKNTLSYTYTDSDLFSGDVTGSVKTYQIAYLSEATIGNSSSQTVVSNDEEFTYFPKLLLDGAVVDWGSVHHLSIFGNSNDSWWFALRDGNTLNNDYYWLNGMMIPDFTDTISFDAYAGSDWAQYGAAPSSTVTNPGTTTTGGTWQTDSYGNRYYYNTTYHYVSDYVYTVTNGSYTYYYPNGEYARAAVAADTTYYISNVTQSTHSSNARYFCFSNGCYYTTASTYTAYMSDKAGSTTTNTTMNYYLNNNSVYTSDGSCIGTAASRGYSSTCTWFCTIDGRFYSSAQSGKSGYYVSTSNSNTVDMNDPYYQYWMMRIAAIQNEQNNTNKTTTTTNKTTKSNKTNTTTTTTSSDSGTEEIFLDDESAFISASTLASLRASGDTMTVKANGAATWTVKGENISVAKDLNLRVIFSTKNIPTALASTVKKNIVASTTLTIGENVAWGANASLTVRYDTKRANFIAKLYRYDSASNSLILINTATVGNTGKVTFNNINHGGDYLITLC